MPQLTKNIEALTPLIMSTYLTGDFKLISFRVEDKVETLAVMCGLPMHYCDFIVFILGKLVTFKKSEGDLTSLNDRCRALWDISPIPDNLRIEAFKTPYAPFFTVKEKMSEVWDYYFPEETGYDALREFVDDLESAHARAYKTPIVVEELFGLKQRAHEPTPIVATPVENLPWSGLYEYAAET